MAKGKRKKRRPSESGPLGIKRLWLPISLVLLVALIVVATRGIMDRARLNALLDRLPGTDGISFSTDTLKSEVARARAVLERTQAEGGLGKPFGQKAGRLGEIYQANHFYDQAISCYEVAMEFDGENARWPYFLAFIRQEKGENESVVNLLEATIALSPRYAPALLKLADSYFKMGKTNQAKAFYSRRLKLVADDPYALLGLARIALDASKWRSARNYLKRAIESNPKFGPAHRLMASVYDHLGLKEQGKRSLQLAAQCTRFRPAPDPWIDSLNDLCYDVEQLLVLGSKAITELDLDKAYGFFTRAMDLDPENPQAYLALGRVCFITGQRRQAHGFFKKAIELNPATDEAYFQMGVMFRQEGKLEEARKMFLKALEFQPDNPNVHNNLGVTLLEQGKFRQAVEVFQKALDIYPEHLNARYNLGLAFWSMGKSARAAQEYRQILSVKPNWNIVANSLAWILATDKNRELRDGNEAVKWARTACKNKGRQNPEYMDTLAAAYAEAGRFEEAIQTALKGLSLARAAGDADLVEELEKRLTLYKAEKSFKE